MEKEIVINGKKFVGWEISLATKTLVLIRGSKGYAMCGYLNLPVAEKFGDTAIIITGVSTVEDMLNQPVVSVTTAAQKLGIISGMNGRDAILLLA